MSSSNPHMATIYDLSHPEGMKMHEGVARTKQSNRSSRHSHVGSAWCSTATLKVDFPWQHGLRRCGARMSLNGEMRDGDMGCWVRD